jgi:CTP synthase (UTP-ammonia lyase)
MRKSFKIGIIGDYRATSRYHVETDAALKHAAAAVGTGVQITWIPTPKLVGGQTEAVLHSFDALWAAPGSPYASMEGALQGIRYARERGKPFVGT